LVIIIASTRETEQAEMNTVTKGNLIGTIVRELRLKAMEVGDSSFCEGDTFFSLAFKTDKELIKIAGLCGVAV
jgi:hypothetical protein